MVEWYVAEAGAETGPYSWAALIAYLETRDVKGLLVWRDGLEAWTPAGDVPEIADALAGRSRGEADIAASELHRPPNIVVKHWRGEYPLWVSFWLFGLGGFLFTARILPIGIGAGFRAIPGYHPKAGFFGVVIFCIVAATLTIWQWVGIWRSAARWTTERRRAGRDTTWAALAQACVLVGALLFSVSFVLWGIPVFVQDFRTAFGASQGDGTTISAAEPQTSADTAETESLLVVAFPVLKTIRAGSPKTYARFIDEYRKSILAGYAPKQATERVRATLRDFMFGLFPIAADDVLVEYNRLIVDHLVELNAKDPTVCYLYMSGGAKTRNISIPLSDALSAREQDIQQRLLDTSKRPPEADLQFVDTLWGKVHAHMLESGVSEDDMSILESKDLEGSRHRLFCDVEIKMWQSIGRLAPAETALLMRDTQTKR